MEQSTKYGRTYHIPGSPGTSSDDKVAPDMHGILCVPVIVQEKLDGEGNCLNKYGVFSRSHGAPTGHPWCNFLKERWALIRNDLGDLAIYGENLYAVHSIEYSRLDDYFFVFGIKDLAENHWLSWEEVEFYTNLLDFRTAPVLVSGIFQKDADVYASIDKFMKEPSVFSDDAILRSPKEGVVIKKSDSFPGEDFTTSVLKWVRKGHVQTDQHWTKNWTRHFLHYERLRMKESKTDQQP